MEVFTKRQSCMRMMEMARENREEKKYNPSKRNHINVLTLLNKRESSGLYRQPRISHKIIKTLICGGNYSYKKVWQRNSNKQISCEGGKIYFENFRHWYGGYNIRNEPRSLQTLPFNGPSRKTEDALLACAQPECLPLPRDGHKSSLYCLERNWLCRYDRDTAKSLEVVFLSPRHSFRDIAWNDPQKSLVLRSTHSRMSSLARQAGVPIPIVMMLAVFEVFPLKFVAMFEISKEVFGKDVIDAVISQDLLISMHQSGKVRMYSFRSILEKYKTFEAELFQEYDDTGHVCGHEPVGLPCNIKITECPPVLFEVRCAHHSVDIGGAPWHYLTSPPGSHQGNFYVRSLDTGQLARNGVLQSDETNLEADKAIFYGDESGRILHVQASEVRILRIYQDISGAVVDVDFSIDLSRKIKVDTDKTVYTSSGRTIKRKFIPEVVRDSSEITIYNVDYEDEMDVLFTSAVYHDPEGVYGMLNLYNNTTGALLKEVRLEQPWPEIYEHQVFLDLDTIIQIIKPSQGRFCCIVYRLHSNAEEEEKSLASLKPTSKKGQTKNHTTVRRNRSRR